MVFPPVSSLGKGLVPVIIHSCLGTPLMGGVAMLMPPPFIFRQGVVHFGGTVGNVKLKTGGVPPCGMRSRIKQQRFCPIQNRNVNYDELVKGYEIF